MCVIMVGEGLCFNLNKELGNLIVYPIMQSTNVSAKIF